MASSDARRGWNVRVAAATPRGAADGSFTLVASSDARRGWNDSASQKPRRRYSFKKVRTTTWAQRNRPDIASHEYYGKCKEFVESDLFGKATTGVLLVNVLLVFLESYLDLSDTLSGAGEEVARGVLASRVDAVAAHEPNHPRTEAE